MCESPPGMAAIAAAAAAACAAAAAAASVVDGGGDVLTADAGLWGPTPTPPAAPAPNTDSLQTVAISSGFVATATEVTEVAAGGELRVSVAFKSVEGPF